jgi:hypothetical protein
VQFLMVLPTQGDATGIRGLLPGVCRKASRLFFGDKVVHGG